MYDPHLTPDRETYRKNNIKQIRIGKKRPLENRRRPVSHFFKRRCEPWFVRAANSYLYDAGSPAEVYYYLYIGIRKFEPLFKNR